MTLMEVIQKLSQHVTFVMFDYAAARIAFDIVWDNERSTQANTEIMSTA